MQSSHRHLNTGTMSRHVTSGDIATHTVCITNRLHYGGDVIKVTTHPLCQTSGTCEIALGERPVYSRLSNIWVSISLSHSEGNSLTSETFGLSHSAAPPTNTEILTPLLPFCTFSVILISYKPHSSILFTHYCLTITISLCYRKIKDPAFLLAVDYANTFDSIRWSLLFKALEMFGFGDFIIDAIKILFKDIKTAIFNNGYSSGYFFPDRGIRQGCCSSPSLFVIAVELMAIMLRTNVQIKGLKVANKVMTVSQYADDTTLFLADYVSLRAAIRTLHEFATWSGLRINHHKSHLLLLGNHLDPPSSFENIQVSDRVKILGIHFKAKMSDKENFELNFEPNIVKIQSICSAWSKRNLSLKGKVTLITSLMISLLQFPATSVPTPQRVFAKFKKIVLDFIWNGKTSKIAYNVMIQDLDIGGLKVPDLENRVWVIHLNWIKYMWREQTSLLSSVLRQLIAYPDVRYLILCKTNLTTRINPHYQMLSAILNTWSDVHSFNPVTEQDVQQESLWFNDSITVNKLPICWRSWLNAGIITVNDILHPEHPRFLSHEEIAEKFYITVSFLNVLQICSCLPFEWRRLLTNPATHDTLLRPHIQAKNNSLLDILKNPSKRLYSTLIFMKRQPVAAQRKWDIEFPSPPDLPPEVYWESN